MEITAEKTNLLKIQSDIPLCKELQKLRALQNEISNVYSNTLCLSFIKISYKNDLWTGNIGGRKFTVVVELLFWPPMPEILLEKTL